MIVLQVLVEMGFGLEALPCIAMYEHLACRVVRNAKSTVHSRVIR